MAKVQFLSMCSHPNVISLISYAKDVDNDRLLLVYPFCPLGSLCDNLDVLEWAQNYSAIICDFGSAIRAGDRHESGTMGYMYPNTTESAKPKIDIYSLGVILLQLVTKKPYSHKNRKHLEDIINEKHKLKKLIDESLLSSGCSKKKGKKTIKLALDCLHGNRPDASEVVQKLDNFF
ncbi:putative serine/threonine-protein kinase PBL3 [Camellia lanceoleosa]|uniref:Serine/threonine-protein kinase PBL3 n=1 Tax=Camellia lanceoleosa TaxID=1840588 RepID=A0ACC0IEW0_9ERIC|nr:putative serine/threonine-protein kinase PBL3 [Camellia lanceoleosa]